MDEIWTRVGLTVRDITPWVLHLNQTKWIIWRHSLMNQPYVYSTDTKLFIIIKMLTNSGEQSTSWQATSGKISQENPHFVWNPTVIIVITSVRHWNHRERDEFCVHPTSPTPQEESNVYWTMHHCNSWRMKDQLDVTCYFISLLMCSTRFGH